MVPNVAGVVHYRQMPKAAQFSGRLTLIKGIDYSVMKTAELKRKTEDDAKESEAKRVKKAPARRRYTYEENHTISRTKDPAAGKEEVKDRIQDHAGRRILIFYYLLLLYYKEGLKVEMQGTTHQFGVSKVKGHHAAHSSILPNVKDNLVDILIEAVEKEGITPEIREKLRHMGLNPDQEGLLEFLKQEEKRPKRTISDEHPLYLAMNSTVELASEVNYFDKSIERVVRDQAVELLNRTSTENLHPYEALKIFVGKLKGFFEICKPQIKLKQAMLPELIAAEKACKKAEQAMATEKTDAAFVRYVDSLMEVKNKHRKLNSENSHSIGIPERGPLKSHKPLLIRIFDCYHKEKNRVEEFKSLAEVKAYVFEMRALFNGRNTVGKIPFGILKQAESSDTLKKATGALVGFLFRCSKGELLLAKGESSQAFLEEWKKMPAWEPQTLESHNERMKVALEILHLQKEATILPKYEMLSGKLENDMRIGLTDEELLEQKHEILEGV